MDACDEPAVRADKSLDVNYELVESVEPLVKEFAHAVAAAERASARKVGVNELDILGQQGHQPVDITTCKRPIRGIHDSARICGHRGHKYDAAAPAGMSRFEGTAAARSALRGVCP